MSFVKQKSVALKSAVASLEAGSLSKRQARALLEKLSPSEFKPKRLRNIVRRAVRRSKTKEFAKKLDTVLEAVHRVHDLGEQMTAMNPRLFSAQRDGTIAREHSEAVARLVDAWTDLLVLV